MNKLFLKYLLVITIQAAVFIFPQNVQTSFSPMNVAASDSIKKNLQILADDSLEGRAVGSKGGNAAANFIAQKFEQYRLKKITDSNSYFQNIQMHASVAQTNSELSLVTNSDTIHFELTRDYFLYRSGQQTFTPVALPLVFVGFGIVAPEFDYNDYQTVDVEGKIVVYLDGEPFSEDEDYFSANIPTVYSYPESKQRIALSRGAAGTIRIPFDFIDKWETVKNDFAFEDVTLAYSVTSNLNIIIKPELAKALFYDAKYSIADVVDMYLNNSIISFPLNTKLKFKGVFKERDFISPNVIGMIEGNDVELKDSYIIISAHYDHLGIGAAVNNDSIYNGALDNAIGVSVLLELANALSNAKQNPNFELKRSLIFIATTGEEKGLLGSSFYIDNPVVPLYKTITNINIDGIAFFRDFVSLIGIGNDYSTLSKTLELVAEENGMFVEEIPDQFRKYDAFNKSDQLAFAIGGIPSVLVLEGTINKSKNKDEVVNAFVDYFFIHYHKPSDDLKQNIDYDAAAKHAKVLLDLCIHLANDEEEPEWKTGSPYINARLRSAAEKR